MDHLTHIAELTQQQLDLDAAKADAITAAHDAGVPVQDIADAARVTRPTIYRVLRQHGTTAEPNRRETFDGALMLLIDLGADPALIVPGLRHSDVDVKARRVIHGLRTLPHGAGTPQQRRVLSDAADLAQTHLNTAAHRK